MNNEIMRIEPKLPATFMPEVMSMFPNMVPVHIPQRQWKTGVVRGFFRGIKVNQIRKEAEQEALISEAKARMVRANCDMVISVVTLASRLDATMEEFKANAQLSKERVIEAQLRNRILYTEAQSAEIDYRMKEREWRKMNGGSEEEDREY
jgi:hypothetical protein